MAAPGPCGPALLPAALALLLLAAALRLFEGGAGPRPPAGRGGGRREGGAAALGGHRAVTVPGSAGPLGEPRAAGRAWGPLPLGAVYAVGLLAFVLLRCLQGQDEVEASSPEPPPEEQLLHREEQLAQQLAQTERLLGGLLEQLEPLFERVDALAGAQQDLLTVRQLLRDQGLDSAAASQVYSPPIHEDPSAEEDDDSDFQTEGWGEEPEEGVTEAWAPSVSWDQAGENGKEWGLRRRKWIEGIQVTD
ncbi:coiled-coil domain-containing protein 107 [Macrotis lagotis]|uniref:coiled-coil domain-containing protein 107 n=1 Tax=Macrotis lagotis TaxID=92651 RepID=UPI003D69E622